MLLKSEDGEIHNLAHIARLRIGEVSPSQDEDDGAGAEAKRFYVEAIPASYGTRAESLGRASIIVARANTRDEAENLLNRILAKASGLDLGKPVQIPAKPVSHGF